MPVSRRHFAPGQLQFITSSTYRRTKLFDSHRFRCDFVEVLRQFGRETGFLLVGWVLRPEHFQRLGAFARGMALVELQVLPT
jgi:REP element-mobilizing transposase RayT